MESPVHLSRLPNVIGLLLCAAMGLTHAAPPTEDPVFLAPEQAFALSAHASTSNQVTVEFKIAEGYYLYQQKISLSADPSVTLGQPAFPVAQIKDDPNFGKMQVYKHALAFTVPVTPASKTATPSFVLTVVAQGCAEAGLCYPPFTQTAKITLPAAASTANVTLDQVKTPVSPVLEKKPAQTPNDADAVTALFKNSNLLIVLMSFFGFGLLLSLTPCVFPMIPILSSIIVSHGRQVTRQRALLLSFTYVLGMATTYTVAGVAAGLSGTLLSAALQNPWVLGGFSLIFVILSLSMFGFYELQLPASMQSRLSNTADRQKNGSLLGIAVMGALSALIVGPCVAAPLAGALLYIAQTKNAILGGAALFSMAMGMGVPLIIVGVVARSALPSAGDWMENVKKIFGVILLAVAIWLVSPVLSTDAHMLAWATLLIFSGVYLRATDSLPVEASGWLRFWKACGMLALVLGLSLLIGVLSGAKDFRYPLKPALSSLSSSAATTAPTFQRVKTWAELQQKLSQSQQPVVLDFYADWCVSCKEMEHNTFSDPTVQQSLKGMTLLQVDVTQNTDDDKALLKAFGLFGPPAILFFDAKTMVSHARVIGYQAPEQFIDTLHSIK
jgi:thiol:disulfide interchange protein DsbD